MWEANILLIKGGKKETLKEWKTCSNLLLSFPKLILLKLLIFTGVKDINFMLTKSPNDFINISM